MSILVSTLNVNQPELTNQLVESVLKDKKVCREILVLENGATEPSKYSTHFLDKNYFFGGGVNTIFDYFLNETKHDWLMILNCDLIIHGENFLSTMLHEAELSDVCTLSPAIINASISQCYWKQMHNWMSGKTRYVEWVDFQAPMLRRDIVQFIKQYPMELIYGWGNDILTGMIAKDYGLKTGVTDRVCITHLNSQTMNKGIIDLDGNAITTTEYCRRAEDGMMKYMLTSSYWERFNQFRQNGVNYKYENG